MLRPGRRRGQRFFCTGYPPCNLSFTRSEHLARHIRKHTGERPFQCHCSPSIFTPGQPSPARADGPCQRREYPPTLWLRLEPDSNDRSAQDRVRPAGRPRTGTMSSTGSHSRGHSRNLSASSVGSTSSNFSVSTEARKRPPPLLMANDSNTRPRLGIEPPSTPPPNYRGYANDSPGGMSTPTSATYSLTPGSPGYGSNIGSPVSTATRTGAFIDPRNPGRRLSVPTGPNPFQQNFNNMYPMTYIGQVPSSNQGSSNSSSVFASPTSATFSHHTGYQVPPWRRLAKKDVASFDISCSCICQLFSTGHKWTAVLANA